MPSGLLSAAYALALLGTQACAPHKGVHDHNLFFTTTWSQGFVLLESNQAAHTASHKVL